MKEEKTTQSIVYVIQEIPGTKEGRPKINIMGAADYGKFKFLLPELSQIIFLVLLALGFLIVVLSSITIKVLCESKNLAAKAIPF